MITSAVGTYFVASILFGLAAAFGIKLRDKVTVPIGAALAPPLAVSAVGLNEGDSFFFLVAPLIAFLSLLVARRSLLEIASHVMLLVGVTGVIRWVFPRTVSISPTALALCLVLTLTYSLAELVRQKVSHRGHAEIREDLKMWWLLQGVLLCACGLTVLVVDRMGWPAFVVMAAVLAVTKHEFDAFGRSRTAYDQTVRALERLAERSERERLVST